MNARTDALSEEEATHEAGCPAATWAVTNTAILLFDLVMLLVSAAALTAKGTSGFDGVVIPTLALFSSFGPTIALAALGATLQNTFAAGNRVLDILDENPGGAAKSTGQPDIGFDRRGRRARHLLLRRREHPDRRIGAGCPEGSGDRHRRPQRQRQVHAAQAADALLGCAAGARGDFRHGGRPHQHGQPAPTWRAS